MQRFTISSLPHSPLSASACAAIFWGYPLIQWTQRFQEDHVDDAPQRDIAHLKFILESLKYVWAMIEA